MYKDNKIVDFSTANFFFNLRLYKNLRKLF